MEIFPANKIPPLAFREHLEVIRNFTEVYCQNIHEPVAIREARCLRAMYPKILAPIQEGDVFAGKLRQPAVCFTPQASGNEGGFGYVCNNEELEKLIHHPEATSRDIKQLQEIRDFWKTETSSYKTRDSYTDILKEALPTDNWTGESGIAFPLYRMAGTQLDYNALVCSGVKGLKEKIRSLMMGKHLTDEKKLFYLSALDALDLFSEICLFYAEDIETAALKKRSQDHSELIAMASALRNISHLKPSTLREAIQLSYLYCIVSGSHNYGRIDDYLGEFYCHDIDQGLISKEESQRLFDGYWRIMISRNAPYDGRVIIGGRGRNNESQADRFALMAIETAGRIKDILPQLSLRFYEGQNPVLYARALDIIGDGCTFPMLYNDDVNIPAAQQAFNISYEEACQVIPFGCGEYMINHKSVGTPSGVLNLLKALEVLLHKNHDPLTGRLAGPKSLPVRFNTFDELYQAYKELIIYYIDALAIQEKVEYEIAGKTAPFLYLSILYDECLSRGKGIFSGGVKYPGGTLEIYGFTNTADSLTAVRQLVFGQSSMSLQAMVNILDADFEGYDRERLSMFQSPKYGNDDAEADALAVDLHNFICNYSRGQRNKTDLHSYLVVNINNDANTTLGRFTIASADGRKAFTSMSNGNAPMTGMDKNGPTALINSLVKLNPSVHAGAVQNMKFSQQMFTLHRDKLEALLRSYFKKGGTQAMITVINKTDLLNAQLEPEKYSNLIVRVGGFSARFVELSPEVQQEIIDRTLY